MIFAFMFGERQESDRGSGREREGEGGDRRAEAGAGVKK